MDIEVTSRPGWRLARVDGVSEEGVRFVDAYTSEQLVVLDSGSIIVPQTELRGLLSRCREVGLDARTDKNVDIVLDTGWGEVT